MDTYTDAYLGTYMDTHVDAYIDVYEDTYNLREFGYILASSWPPAPVEPKV